MFLGRSLLICLSDIANSLNKRVNVDDIRLKLSILLEKEVVLVLQTSIGSFSQKMDSFWLINLYPALRSLYLIVVHVFIYRFSVMCMLLVFTETNYTIVNTHTTGPTPDYYKSKDRF